MDPTVELRLPALPSSVGEARHAVRRLLVNRGASEDLIDQVVLLVSEVVTNAVLHAGTEVVVAATATAAGAHVRVTDYSSVLPSPRHHEEDASTGRGILLVEAISNRWGTTVSEGAKTVWFTVGDGQGAGPEGIDQADPTACRITCFLGLHVAMARATLTYGEAVVRELALVEPPAPGEERGWAVPGFSLGPLWAQLDAATAAGEEVVDLEVEFPSDEIDHCLERMAVVEEADRLAREGRLLAVPAVPEIGHYRRWIYRQIHGQAHGAEPEPWTAPPAGLQPAVEPVELADVDIERLVDIDTAVVLADDGNRIVYANASAEQLLGWEDVGLAGARLTEIVPTEHRLAHLAGFVRYQVTGIPQLLGSTVEVPALRRNGSVIPVSLTLTEGLTAAGRRVFRAALVPVEAQVGAAS